jgi:hypothetical protein
LTGAISGAVTAHPSEHLSSSLAFRVVHVAQSLVFRMMFKDHCFSFYLLSIVMCVWFFLFRGFGIVFVFFSLQTKSCVISVDEPIIMSSIT